MRSFCQAIVLQEAYHQKMKVAVSEDWQLAHHYETLMQGLIHDGRFKERMSRKRNARSTNSITAFTGCVSPWPSAIGTRRSSTRRLFQGQDQTSYLRGLVYIRKGDYERARPEVNVLREAFQTNRTNKDIELRLWTAQGLLLCGTGGDGGLKLLAKAVEKTKDDYNRHAWGHGAYFMENWGLGT